MTLDLTLHSQIWQQKHAQQKQKIIMTIKIKTFGASKDISKKAKQPSTEWDKLLANQASNKGLASKMYKEFL